MDYVIKSLVNYIFLFFLFCLLQVGLIVYYKRKHIELKKGFIVGYQILICLLIAIFTITGISGIDNIFIQTNKHMNFVLYLENILSFQCVMNMIMFIPLGIILPLLWKGAKRLDVIMISGFCLSLFIETSQLFNYRASDVNDILTNMIGILLGYIIYRLFLTKIHYFEVSDQNRLIKYHAFFQIMIISVVYFFIGSPILSSIYGF